MEQQDEKIAKKDYHSPKLSVYGNVSEMTYKGGTTGKSDNPGGAKT